MAGKIRQTEINIETHEVKIVRLRGKRFSVYCERCEAKVEALTIEQTAALIRITLTDVCRLIGEDKIHLVGTMYGLPFVCGGSLGNEGKPMLKASPNQL